MSQFLLQFGHGLVQAVTHYLVCVCAFVFNLRILKGLANVACLFPLKRMKNTGEYLQERIEGFLGVCLLAV